MKNTRVITAVVAFAVTFIFSAGLVRIILPAPVVRYVTIDRPRVIERNSNEIEAFLLRDIDNGSARMDYKYTDNYAEAVMDYWKTSSSMDSSRFPQDFQNKWREHMQAWRNYADYLEERSSSRRDCSEGKRLIGEINRTWEEVKSSGRTYGAYVQ
ncbi:MAG TPA: hypothetical protein VNB22_17510 [Pyrinomonadaceae bacterium]|nr:hypothetical protein [Pyrinomonadaceae bacterium]